MSITDEQLKESGRLTNKNEAQRGIWKVHPPLALIALQDGADQMIKKGKIYHAVLYDEDGKYPGHLHFHPEAGFWWHIDMFDFAPN